MIELLIERRRRDLRGFSVGRVLPYAQRRMVGGAETVGTGGAVSRRISDRVVLGVGAGVVIPIPEDGGLETDDLRLAVGVTASFW